MMFTDDIFLEVKDSLVLVFSFVFGCRFVVDSGASYRLIFIDGVLPE